ncbi:unnamed protein product [Citrullus colocynthis]|uniref:Uncharacterized protein n=1 Tax=Citrullus colocynthis TaxID=252529 RepID=A0ABP0Y2T5_9ROSI
MIGNEDLKKRGIKRVHAEEGVDVGKPPPSPAGCRREASRRNSHPKPKPKPKPEPKPFLLQFPLHVIRHPPFLCNSLKSLSLSLSLFSLPERETETDSIAFFVHQLYQIKSFLSSHSILSFPQSSSFPSFFSLSTHQDSFQCSDPLLCLCPIILTLLFLGCYAIQLEDIRETLRVLSVVLLTEEYVSSIRPCMGVDTSW